MRKTIGGALLSLLCGGGGLPAQATWVVDNEGRPGAHFATIQEAVDAAAPGDIVRVRVGSAPYAGATIGKGLQLLGEAEVTLNTELVIDGIPAGQRVAVKNFALAGTLPRGTAEGRAVVCARSAGTIHFERVRGAGSRHGPALSVDACSHVSALDCVFDAGVSAETYFFFGTRYEFHGGAPGVSCRASSLLLTRCRAHGALAWSPRTTKATLERFKGNWSGATADGAHVVLVQSELTGGDACPLGPPMGPFPPAKPALAASNGCTLITKDTTLVGGLECPFVPALVAGIEADPATVVVRDPAVAFSVLGGQVVEQTLYDLQTAGVGPGATLNVTLRSTVAAPYVTVASFPLAPSPAPPIGIWLDLFQAIPLFQGTVSGAHTDAFRVPPFFPQGLPAAFQSVLLVGGRLELSTPVVAVLY